CQKYSISPLTF
nr:immunoglobulin light chain junction region [Macaca mulatta]